jgi:ribosomal protein L31
MKQTLTLDDALRPMTMTCGNCGKEMTVYPCPIPEGTGVCPKCSPMWLDNFAKFMMNQERVKRGLTAI